MCVVTMCIYILIKGLSSRRTVKKRKADHLGPPAKLQRLTQCCDKSRCGSCHKDVAKL